MKERQVANVIGLIACVVILILMFIPRTKEEPSAKVETVEEKSTVVIKVEEPEEVKQEVRFYSEKIPLTYEEQAELYRVCELNLVPYDLALAVIYVETGFRNVVGDQGNSYGYFQIQPRWTADRMREYGITDLMDYKQNFMLGTGLLGSYINQHGLVDGLTRYNTGHFGESPYATKVLQVREEVINNELISD